MVGWRGEGYLGGIHYWWPKISGRAVPGAWARLSAVIIFLGFNLTFSRNSCWAMRACRAAITPIRRSFQVLNVHVHGGSEHLGRGLRECPLVYLIWSPEVRSARGSNPWGATGVGMADAVAAAHGEFRAHAGGHRGGLRLLGRRGGTACLRRPRALATQFDDLGATARRRYVGHVDLPGHRDHVLRRPVRRLRGVSFDLPRRPSRPAAACARSRWGPSTRRC